ncbi:MAG: UDPGP type 1 family protein [Lentisphaerae bacterium]|jgi:UDP-N-acetylglucosamine/UDP-N-acetylgalactosamine diphosphorylase|nr:UDPGP type 1 family protein [Lentisphaerota bacterium]MBT4819216.1 UDPGP type 1 family protein [Lentisphaerota bacterium]MBT5611037.1 UDPGP type 1 family protein [Lentisphaerota bacterium]MBT7053967.1 UDPGP type 1 family protein [Lentisphaerota bacterium]MBT7841049.1 UDPGP type 1 family protein [Lentisphaerota bacterium]
MHDLRTLLETHNQGHVLAYWDEISEDGREQLVTQLRDLDWEQLDAWIEDALAAESGANVPASLEPAPYYPLIPETAEQIDLYRKAEKRGRDLLGQGRIAAFTVAGGQGTRLGYDGPKGTYPISPVAGKTLFQLFAEGVARAGEKYGVPIAWYIMTSPINDAATRAFFAENAYFGLRAEDVTMFPQGTLPAIDPSGRLLLGAKDSLALSPNGHGGSLLALRDHGCLADMAKRGVDHMSYWQVDNPLVYQFDPLFLGLHDLTGSDMSSRSLTKTGPFEKLGNFCLTDDGRCIIVEYSDMPDELAEATDVDGRLRFRAGSPAIHVLRRAFIDRVTQGRLDLPIHRADKKVTCIGEGGITVAPTEPNAIKMETFIFDGLPLAENPLILEGDRAEQFGPVKNVNGIDSAESCRQLLIERAARWLEQGGVPVPRRPDGTVNGEVELSPRRFLGVDDVKAAASGLRPPAAEAEEYYG